MTDRLPFLVPVSPPFCALGELWLRLGKNRGCTQVPAAGLCCYHFHDTDVCLLCISVLRNVNLKPGHCLEQLELKKKSFATSFHWEAKGLLSQCVLFSYMGLEYK